MGQKDGRSEAMSDQSPTTDINLHAKLVETIAPMLTRTSGLGVGLVGRATMRRAEAIADAVLARIIDEGCIIVLIQKDRPSRSVMTEDADPIERARHAFGDALSCRVNMATRLGDVPVWALREAMMEALAAADRETVK